MAEFPAIPNTSDLRRFGSAAAGSFRISVRIGSRLVSPTFTFIADFIAVKAHFLAAAIALFSFLSLFPLTIALITVLHLTLGAGAYDEALHEAIERQIPLLSDSEYGVSFVAEFLSQAAENSALTSSLAGLILFVSTLGVFSAICESVNIVWGIERRRTFFKQRLVDALMMVLASGLLLASILVSAVFSFLGGDGQAVAFNTETIRSSATHVAGVALPWAITYCVLTVIYWWLPNTNVRIKDVLPIALIATIFFELIKFAFISYLHYLTDQLLSIYGSLAALMMFFLFIYIEAIVMLAGAMLCAKWTAYLQSRNQMRLMEDAKSDWRREADRLRLTLRRTVAREIVSTRQLRREREKRG